MAIVTASGWGQPYDALASIAPDAIHADYARHDNVEDALGEFAYGACDTAIGWSLGGQLIVRAVAAGLLRPKRLVLIATPFQFVASSDVPHGMKRDLYAKFHDNYARDAMRTLHKAWELIAKGDKHAPRVRLHMERQPKEAMLEKHWLRWLQLLDSYSCEELDFSDFPPTLLIHGDGDAVVDQAQSTLFAQRMPAAKRIVFEGCGHAPHWHDTEKLRKILSEQGYV